MTPEEAKYAGQWAIRVINTERRLSEAERLLSELAVNAAAAVSIVQGRQNKYYAILDTLRESAAAARAFLGDAQKEGK